MVLKIVYSTRNRVANRSVESHFDLMESPSQIIEEDSRRIGCKIPNMW